MENRRWKMHRGRREFSFLELGKQLERTEDTEVTSKLRVRFMPANGIRGLSFICIYFTFTLWAFWSGTSNFEYRQLIVAACVTACRSGLRQAGTSCASLIAEHFGKKVHVSMWSSWTWFWLQTGLNNSTVTSSNDVRESSVSRFNYLGGIVDFS